MRQLYVSQLGSRFHVPQFFSGVGPLMFYCFGLWLFAQGRCFLTTGSSDYLHGVLVLVAAVWALPDQLVAVLDNLDFARVSALHAGVVLRVKLGIYNRIVDMLNDSKNSRNVVLHVWYLYVRNRSAWGQLLELCLVGELVERVDFLAYDGVVRVRDVVVVGDIFDDAESTL